MGRHVSNLGHNGGPTLESGKSWRSHCWRQARAALLPTLPIEVVRLRVRRAAEIGLDYKTYAGVRAATGHDIVAFLFSTNALRLLAPRPVLSADRRARLAAISNCGKIALAQAPLTGETVLAVTPVLNAAHPAPRSLSSEHETRQCLRAALGMLPSDTVLLIGDTDLERGWMATGRLAGYVPADRFFAGI